MVLWANSVKLCVQKCHESWARFSPYSLISVFLYILQPISIPVSRVLLFHYCTFIKWCYWWLSCRQWGYYVIFICSSSVFVLTSILLIFLVPSSCLEWRPLEEQSSWLSGPGALGLAVIQAKVSRNRWQNLCLDTGPRKIMRTHTCSWVFTHWCGRPRRGQGLFETGR